jgi:HK97 family phage prohead protease
MTEQRIADAAAARAASGRARADRPSQRRYADHPGARGSALVRARIELRDAGTSGRLDFSGLASAYEAPYEMYDFFGPYTEIVSAGAGSGSLARADLDVPLVLGHDQLRRIARTTNGSLTLAESDDGLAVDAPDLDAGDADVAYIAPKLRAGLIDEMSFAFRIRRGQWSPDYTEFRIAEYDIHRGDVAIVGFGANPYTDAALREQRAPQTTASSRARALLDLAIAR